LYVFFGMMTISVIILWDTYVAGALVRSVRGMRENGVSSMWKTHSW
jgi:hypothetical protein